MITQSDIHEPNHTDAYWGSNYGRLLSIKKKYDPKNRFQVWHGVGTNEQDPRWNCYKK